MSRRKTQKTIRIGSGLVPRDSPEYKADYRRRLKAAGLGADAESDDAVPIDTIRRNVGRQIVMSLNKWPGCRETICQRMRGCMAPSGDCSNLPPVSREEVLASWPETKMKVRRAIATEIARRKAAGEWDED